MSGREYTLQPSPKGAVGALRSDVPGYLNQEWVVNFTFDGVNTGVTGTEASKYTRVGNILFFNTAIQLTSKGAQTGDVELYNLPYGAFGVAFPGAVVWANFTTAFVHVAHVIETGTLGGICIKLVGAEAADTSLRYLTEADFANNTYIALNGYYWIYDG